MKIEFPPVNPVMYIYTFSIYRPLIFVPPPEPEPEPESDTETETETETESDDDQS